MQLRRLTFDHGCGGSESLPGHPTMATAALAEV
jgi:hypothetical protein